MRAPKRSSFARAPRVALATALALCSSLIPPRGVVANETESWHAPVCGARAPATCASSLSAWERDVHALHLPSGRWHAPKVMREPPAVLARHSASALDGQLWLFGGSLRSSGGGTGGARARVRFSGQLHTLTPGAAPPRAYLREHVHERAALVRVLALGARGDGEHFDLREAAREPAGGGALGGTIGVREVVGRVARVAVAARLGARRPRRRRARERRRAARAREPRGELDRRRRAPHARRASRAGRRRVVRPWEGADAGDGEPRGGPRAARDTI